MDSSLGDKEGLWLVSGEWMEGGRRVVGGWLEWEERTGETRGGRKFRLGCSHVHSRQQSIYFVFRTYTEDLHRDVR